MIKSNPIPAGSATHKLKNNIPKKFSHCCDSSEPHIRLPSLGIQQRDWDPQGI